MILYEPVNRSHHGRDKCKRKASGSAGPPKGGHYEKADTTKHYEVTAS